MNSFSEEEHDQQSELLQHACQRAQELIQELSELLRRVDQQQSPPKPAMCDRIKLMKGNTRKRLYAQETPVQAIVLAPKAR